MRHAILILVMLFATAAHTRPLTSAENAELTAQLDVLSQALIQQDMQQMFRILPPRLIDAIADRAGVSVESLRGRMAQTQPDALGGVTFKTVAFDISDLDVEQFEHPDGSIGYYGLFSATFVMKIPDRGTIQSEAEYLAIYDQGGWYAIDFGTQYDAILLLYPFVADLRQSAPVITELD